MAKITWLGEDTLHATHNEHGEVVSEGAGPSWTMWRGIRFDKGKHVDITDSELIAKAKGNRFFKVEGAPGRPFGTTKVGLHPAEDDDKDDDA